VAKLAGDGDATPLGGTFSSPYVLRGLNNAGKALFQANVAAGSSPWGLFLKHQASDPQVVFAALQAVPGGNIVSLLQASLNNQDKALFLAGLQGGSAPIGWYLGSGTADPVKIALQGESTPLGGTFGIQGRQAPWHLNDAGQVAFATDILGPNAVAAFLWESGVPMRAVVSSNDLLPLGANQVIRAQQGAPVLTSRHEVVFRAFNAGGKVTAFAKPIESGMDGLRRLWGEFDPAPGGGVILGSSSLGATNDSGAYVFSGPVLGGATYPGSGIFGMRPGEALQAIALSGDSAPGGGFFSGFGVPQLNNTSQVAFWGGVAGGPPGIFVASPGLAHQKIAQVGDPRPGGGTFGTFNSAVTLNDSGQVGFFGSRFEAPQIGGLFVGKSGGMPQKVVAQNDVIDGAGTVNGISTPWDMNSTGQLAFLLQILGSPYGNTSGVFYGSGGGTPSLLALAGAPAPGTDGGIFGNLRADNIDINDAGQVAFWAGINSSPTGVWNGVYLSTAGSSPVPWFMKNRSLPDGSSAIQMGGASRSIALSESGELAVYVVAEKNDPERDDELPRIVIVGSDGALRLFAVTAERAEGTGSYFGRIYPQLSANAAGRFFFSSIMVNGPAKAGFFWNGLEKK
jgi:hypothetical protein